VIRLVLPTLCSPRKTSLNFFRGEVDDEEKFVWPGAGEGVVDMAAGARESRYVR
jgi:hypothetical protein